MSVENTPSFVLEKGVPAEDLLYHGQNYDIFISHPGKNQKVTLLADYVTSELRGEAERKKMDLSVFVDSVTLKNHVGEEFDQVIDDAVRGCRIFVCFLAEEYFRSYWCLRELGIAMQQRTGGSNQNYLVIPIAEKFEIPALQDDLLRRKIREKQKVTDAELIEMQLEQWKTNVESLANIQGIYARFFDDKAKRRDEVSRLAMDILKKLRTLRGPSNRGRIMRYLIIAAVVLLFVAAAVTVPTRMLSRSGKKESSSQDPPASTSPLPRPTSPPFTVTGDLPTSTSQLPIPRPTSQPLAMPASTSTDDDPMMDQPMDQPMDRTTAIVEYINSITLAGDVLRYPLPPSPTTEERALAWIIEDDPLQLTVETAFKRFQVLQRYSVVTLWFSSKEELFPFNRWLTSDHECDWAGVQCLEPQRVCSRLNFFDGNVNGQLSSDLGRLSDLTYVDFAGCDLTGTIPSALRGLTRLSFMNLASNPLSGTIPESLGRLTNLQALKLDRTRTLTGTIPSTFAALTALTELTIQANQVSGTMPVCEQGRKFFIVADCFLVECPCCSQCCPALNGIPQAVNC